VPQLPDDFDDLVRRARARLDLPEPIEPFDGEDGGEPVQLSIRLSPRLRHDIAQVARRRGHTVTTFVTEALEDAVRVATDPFAGLAAKMTQEFRAELGKAIDSGAYADVAAEIDRLEGWDR
jgi:predicted DNA-binding protein